MEVTVYSTKACHWCKVLKNYLDEHKVEYKSVDVGEDQEEARKLVEKTKQMGVPQTKIVDDEGKEHFIIGFNEEKIKELLKIKE